MSEIIIKTDKGAGEEFKVDERIKDCSGLIKGQLEINKDAIPINTSAEIFKKVLSYLKAHDFKPTYVKKPIQSDKLEVNLDETDYRFIAGYDLESVKDILDAAIYLQCDTLKELCIARIATEFYIGNSLDDILKIEMKYGKVKELTAEEEAALVKEYPWAKRQLKTAGTSDKLIVDDIMMVEDK